MVETGGHWTARVQGPSNDHMQSQALIFDRINASSNDYYAEPQALT
jgi:hypothetical protein